MKIAKYKNACKETKQGGMRLLLRQANPLRTHFIHAQGCENSKQEKKCAKRWHILTFYLLTRQTLTPLLFAHYHTYAWTQVLTRHTAKKRVNKSEGCAA